MSTEHLVKNLQAEFVIQHRAGGHDVSDEFLANFIGRTMRNAPTTDTALILPLDLAVIRYSVVCEKWGNLSNSAAPHFGAFLAGWYMRCVGLPPPMQYHISRESLRAGWAQANEQVAINVREARRE